MIVGALGDVIFQVSYKKIETVKSLTWNGSARWATHDRHNWHALTEYTGIDPDRISLEIYLSEALGADTMGELVKLWAYEREGTPNTLVLGDHAYGKYRWVIESHSTETEVFDHSGNLTACTVKLELLEYLKN